MAAMHPDPAAVIACLYLWSWTSPQAKTPSMFVFVLWGSVSIYPKSSIASLSMKSEVFGVWPMAIKMPSKLRFVSLRVFVFRIFTPSTEFEPSISVTSESQRKFIWGL